MHGSTDVRATPRERALAWSVHLYTALGAPIAFAAFLATLADDARAAFLWMAAALLIDSTDGTLARTARVKEVLPGFDGARLDDIVDYLNYVVVPVFFAWHFGMLPETVSFAVATAPLLASAYGFCQADAKTADHMFKGFPSYWNIVVFYLYALDTTPVVNATVLIGLSVLVFVPIGYVYASRTPFLRVPTLVLGGLWGIVMLWTIVQLPETDRTLLWLTLVYPLYYFALSLALHFRRPVPSRSTNP